MQEFIKNNSQYSKEHILKATKAYIEDRKTNNLNWFQQADYFIKKNQDHTRTNFTSRLLQWCEEIENNGYKETNNEIVQGI